MASSRREDYRRIRPERTKVVTLENEIRVTARHGNATYIEYAISVLNGEEGRTKSDTIMINGMASAIHKAVSVAEIVKHRVPGLHQITEISSEEVTDVYEPVKEEGENLTINRQVSTIRITLSRNQLDASNPGYQAPIPEDQVRVREKRAFGEGGAPRGRGAARGAQRKPQHEDPEHPDVAAAPAGRGGRGGAPRGGRHGPRRGRGARPAGEAES